MPPLSPPAPASSPTSRDELVEAAVAEIRAIVARELDCPAQVGDDAHLLRDLALDSYGLMVIAVGLEDRFRVKLAEEDAGQIETVRDLARLVAQRVEEGSAR